MKNLGFSHTRGQIAQNIVDRDSQISNAWLTAPPTRGYRDSIRQVHTNELACLGNLDKTLQMSLSAGHLIGAEPVYPVENFDKAGARLGLFVTGFAATALGLDPTLTVAVRFCA